MPRKPALGAVLLVVLLAILIVAALVWADAATGIAGGVLASLAGLKVGRDAIRRREERHLREHYVRTLQERAQGRMREVESHATETAAGTDRERTAERLRRRLGL